VACECVILDSVDRGGRFRVASIAGPIAVGYGLVASLAVGLALALRDGVPWQHPSPWLHLLPLEASALSGFLGLVIAILVVVATRITVWRFSWAQRLHLELRPIARGLVLWQIMLIAFFSSLGEELVFRGLLQPWLGLLPTAVVFGLCHQMPGPARWVWVCWAMAVGLVFGAIFYATGSLVGPLAAHAVINAVNLTFLRDHDPLAGAQVGAPQ
jgi:CAAX protease family protein